MEIIITTEQCNRIKTSEDLSDLYAYFERDYVFIEDEEDFDDFCNRLPTYYFDTSEEEQERINSLVDGINYTAGVYNEENVKRILGGKLWN